MKPEIILKNIERNIYDRAILIKKCEEEEEVKQHIYMACEKDITYFFKYFVWTDRNT